MPIIRSLGLYLCYYCIRCVTPWLLVAGGQKQGSRLCIRDERPHPKCIAATSNKASHIICGNNTSIVSCSWWWACKCPKYVEQIISAINHSVASSWFCSLCLHNDALTNIHQEYLGCSVYLSNNHWRYFCAHDKHKVLNTKHLVELVHVLPLCMAVTQ